MNNDNSRFELEEKRDRRRGIRFWLATLVVGVVVLGFAYTQYMSASSGTMIQTISIVDNEGRSSTSSNWHFPQWLTLPFDRHGDSEANDEPPEMKSILQAPLRTNQATVSGISAILQNPELPAGCEATSLTIVLNQMGYTADKVDIADNYMPRGDNVAVSYVGDPREEYGGAIYTPGLAITAEKYLKEQKADAVVYDLWDMSFTNLCKIVAAGYPVIVWTTLENEEPYGTQPAVTYNGRSYDWYTNQHCVVLYGYDLYNNVVYISDPMVGLVQRNAVQFDLIYTQCGMNAMAIIS